jgi:hypothetical protein
MIEYSQNPSQDAEIKEKLTRLIQAIEAASEADTLQLQATS